MPDNSSTKSKCHKCDAPIPVGHSCYGAIFGIVTQEDDGQMQEVFRRLEPAREATIFCGSCLFPLT